MCDLSFSLCTFEGFFHPKDDRVVTNFASFTLSLCTPPLNVYIYVYIHSYQILNRIVNRFFIFLYRESYRIVSYIYIYIYLFILRDNDSRFYYCKSLCTIRKRKDRHSSNQTMSSSFSFAILARASEARLHNKGMLKKKKKNFL